MGYVFSPVMLFAMTRSIIKSVKVPVGEVVDRTNRSHRDSTIDPYVTSPPGVRCKQTSVSRLVVEFQSPYRCCLVRRTPYACSPLPFNRIAIHPVTIHVLHLLWS